MIALAAKPRRDWGKVLTLGYIEDRNGKRRQFNWYIYSVFGLAIPGLAIFALYQIVAAAIPVASFSPAGVYHMLTAYAPVGLWVLAIVMFKVTNLGVTIYYHRGLTHRGFKMNLGLEIILACMAGMSWQGSAFDWVEDHRRHHAKGDIVGEDPHTPWEYPGLKGLLWAQWFWLFFKVDRRPRDSRSRDLRYNPVVIWQDRLFLPVLAPLSLVIPFVFYGWKGVLIAGVLRIAAHMTVTGFINSWCHMWGTRTKDSRGREYVADDSRNSIVVALLGDGEGLHNGHHAEPASPHHGFTADLDDEAIDAGVKPDRRWRPDFTWRCIQVLALVHLVWGLKTPKKIIYFNDAAIAPKKELRAIHERDALVSRSGARARAYDLQYAPRSDEELV
jgi:stearoyl-CoA desaturase (delta-9 desaturase)